MVSVTEKFNFMSLLVNYHVSARVCFMAAGPDGTGC